MSRILWLFVLALFLPTLSYAKWSEDWTSQSKVTVNAQGASGAVTNLPVVIRLHSGNFNFADAKPDGSDLRFIAADDKTELKFQIEKYDSINELAVIWVQLPKVDPKEKDAHFSIYYGNPKAPASPDVSVWDANTVAAFHFAEKSLLQDSSSSNLTASGQVTVQKAALLGESAVFAASPITIASSPNLKHTAASGFTWSAWIKPGSLPQQATLYSQGDGVSFVIADQQLKLTVGSTAISGGNLKPAAWQHVAFVIDSGKATIYLDGVAVANGDAASPEVNADIKIGDGYTGELDELEISNTARSSDWLKLSATGQGADSQLITVKSSEGDDSSDDSDSGPNYISILIKSLTPDAKVVIAILAVMFAISVWVMVQKARLVSLTDKNNRAFMARFQKASSDLLSLDQDDSKYKKSSLYKLYSSGLREIKKREVSGQKLALSGAAMDAIKAAIDADLVRETQRQNAGMVLLTIAISGGPFLGLLGTVVGVMITFAAIAAAGDVNVNAIAPGIAAALLATVAGLGVAIPSLFGYNYLASRVKNITIEMQIFVDEFVTRVAELYGN